MNRQFERYLQITLILLDLLVLNSIFFVCQIIFQTHLLTNIANAYFNFWVVSNIFWIIPSFILRTYAGKIIITFEYFTRRTIQVYSFWILLLLFYLFFSFEVNISRLFIFTIIISFGVGLLINRFLYLGIRNYYKKSDHIFKKVLILGYNDTAKKLTRYFEEDGINTQIIGFVEDEGNVHELTHYPVLSGIGNTLQIAKDNDINEIFSTITPEQNKSIYDLMFQSEKECIRFKIVPNLSVFITRDVHIEYFGDLPILSLRSEPLDDVGNRIKKRALDLVVSSLVIILILSWMIPILGLLILLES
ncbi:MAG TPA: undecaprenyl-phosphate glucose phosphotransferase, partial [Ferruginibacter sp.]|nr:undecaprenyl-phosphate glucose phosphotransferase [Ferruginibacter sp.]